MENQEAQTDTGETETSARQGENSDLRHSPGSSEGVGEMCCVHPERAATHYAAIGVGRTDTDESGVLQPVCEECVATTRSLFNYTYIEIQP